jgi:hypothetical protein
VPRIRVVLCRKAGIVRDLIESNTFTDLLERYRKSGALPPAISGGDHTDGDDGGDSGDDGSGNGNDSTSKDGDGKDSDNDGKSSGKNDGPKPKVLEQDGTRYLSQDDVDRLIGETRIEARKTVERELKATADREAAKKAGDWEKVAVALEKERDDLKLEVAKRDLADLRRTIGKRHNLPDKLIDRLTGSDEATITADAKDLAKEFAITDDGTSNARKAPTTEAGAGAKNRSDNSGRQQANDKKPKANYAFIDEGDVRWN